MKYLTIEELKTIDCPGEEQETTIVFTRNDTHMQIYTSDNTMLTKLKRLVKEDGGLWKCWCAGLNSGGNPTGYFFEGPKNMLTLRGKKRELTEEQKLASANRMKQMWVNKNS